MCFPYISRMFDHFSLRNDMLCNRKCDINLKDTVPPHAILVTLIRQVGKQLTLIDKKNIAIKIIKHVTGLTR